MMLNIANHQSNVNQNQNEISPHTCQNGYNKEKRDNRCWQGCAEKGTMCTVDGNVNWFSHSGEVYGVS